MLDPVVVLIANVLNNFGGAIALPFVFVIVYGFTYFNGPLFINSSGGILIFLLAGFPSFFFSDKVMKLLVSLHLFSNRWLISDTDSKSVVLFFISFTIFLVVTWKSIVENYKRVTGKDDPNHVIRTKKNPSLRDYKKLYLKGGPILDDKDFSFFHDAFPPETYQQIMSGPESEYEKLLIMAWVFEGVPLERARIKVNYDLEKNLVPDYVFKHARNTKKEQPA
ncbi:hypothetical protein SAMN04487897_13115 [Paenibacillus sp. yr247]|uniref:hypothetical protein n=1 Tax=Paenibacillus sp. yr247 TaxID=1761880 RepID=UPI000881BCB4|nr:hypothetical protein [Paenibacillus sp. yr247]SDP02017.1 hypothetical protein SAMN04487897_13115 [Paenibacillus sp. yr247]